MSDPLLAAGWSGDTRNMRYLLWNFTGSAWEDVTSSVDKAVAGYFDPRSSTVISDMIVYGGATFVTIGGEVQADTDSRGAILQLSAGHWIVSARYPTSGKFSSFIVYHGSLYCFGSKWGVAGTGSDVLQIWKLTSSGWVLQNSDDDHDFAHTDIVYNAVAVNPFHDEIMHGAWDDDAWGTWSPSEGFGHKFELGGSCVWAYGQIGNTVLSGDYGNYLYSSTDGRTWKDEFGPEGPLEIWDFFTYRGHLYAAGCDYNRSNFAAIMRVDGVKSFTLIDSIPTPTLHVGFIDTVTTTAGIYLACGSEPHYYRIPTGGAGLGVYFWNGGQLIKIGQDLPPHGAYLVSTGRVAGAVPLRQYPRDDGRSGTSGPRQRSQVGGDVRQGWKNRIR